jgi:peptide/nickel transport system permease protein
MLEVLQQDYVRTARSKGAAERMVIYAHALRNALLPVVTVISIVGLTLFSAAVVIEVVFAIPGIGMLVTDSVLKRDYPTILGAIICVGVGYAFVNLAVDLIYALLDPRVKYG